MSSRPSSASAIGSGSPLMSEPAQLGSLGRRLAWSFLLVSLISLAVLFVGTVVPHLPSGHLDPHDPVSLVWLLVATVIAVGTAALLSLGIARRLIRPVDGYIDTARRFAEGDHSARPDDLGPPEFHELANALVAAADEVERSELARQQLTADIAHELRTPLTALQAGLEELRDGLDPSRSGRLSPRSTIRPADWGASSTTSANSRQRNRRGSRWTSRMWTSLAWRRWPSPQPRDPCGPPDSRSSGTSPRVCTSGADPDRMHQVVGNLLANAALYCHPGDVVIVRVRVGRVGRSVGDRGHGAGLPRRGDSQRVRSGVARSDGGWDRRLRVGPAHRARPRAGPGWDGDARLIRGTRCHVHHPSAAGVRQ